MPQAARVADALGLLASPEDAPEPVEGVEEDFGADEAPEEGFEVLASLPAFGAASESALSFCHSG